MRKINTLIANTFNISEKDSLQNYSMEEVLNWDSLTHMDLIVNIEKEFNIQLSGDDIADMISFDAIRATVNKYIN